MNIKRSARSIKFLCEMLNKKICKTEVKMKKQCEKEIAQFNASEKKDDKQYRKIALDEKIYKTIQSKNFLSSLIVDLDEYIHRK